jgi:hypothetical protein
MRIRQQNYGQLLPPIQRSTPMTTPSNAATPFGCCNYFDHCADEILSLHYSGGLPLLDWMGFEVSDECYRALDFISFVRPEYTGGVATVGYIGDPCDDPNGFEYGACSLTVEDFGRYGRHGPVRDFMKPRFYCKTDPRRRLDGTLVTDEREWDMRFAMDTIIQDISNDLVTGNATTAGQFDGLQRWVRTGYDCAGLDSIVIDWNGNGMAGGNGITWNGAAVANTFDIIDVLNAAFRRIKQRIMWSPLLKTQPLMLGDMILVLPTFMIQCLLDFYTCWSVCGGTEYNPVALMSYEARQFRNQLIATSPENLFGDGYIKLDNVTIPLLGYDWSMINGPTLGDMYFLTGAVGSNRIWEGEHISATTAAARMGNLGYFSTDGGRVLGLIEADNECERLKLWMHPRLFCRAPWAQIRFQDVRCEIPGGPLSPDPTETSFYPETSFSAAECP